jgi:hypothetical protein
VLALVAVGRSCCGWSSQSKCKVICLLLQDKCRLLISMRRMGAPMLLNSIHICFPPYTFRCIEYNYCDVVVGCYSWYLYVSSPGHGSSSLSPLRRPEIWCYLLSIKGCWMFS